MLICSSLTAQSRVFVESILDAPERAETRSFQQWRRGGGGAIVIDRWQRGRWNRRSGRCCDSLWRLYPMQQNSVPLLVSRRVVSICTPTGPNTIAEHRQRKPGTSIGRLVLLSDMIPTTTCAEKIQLSVTPMMTTVQRETFANVDGVRVTSICRTSRTSTRS